MHPPSRVSAEARRHWRQFVGRQAKLIFGSSPHKSETIIGTLISAGRRTLWVYLTGEGGKDPQDVFIRYEQIKDVEFL